MSKKKYPYVRMEARVQVLDECGSVHPDPGSLEEFGFGGYCFIVDGKEVSFDWDAWSADCDGSRVTIETGYGCFFNDFNISEDYDEALLKAGLTRYDLTAEFLSRCEEIQEFACEGGDVLIEYVTFLDESNKEYRVKDEVIREYNKKVKHHEQEVVECL